MKIRKGFVSNSSSTSFVLTCAKSQVDEVLGTLQGHEQALLSALDSSIGTLFGISTIQYSGWDGECGSISLDDLDYAGKITDKDGREVEEVDYNYRYVDDKSKAHYSVVTTTASEAVDRLMEVLKKKGYDYLYNSQEY